MAFYDRDWETGERLDSCPGCGECGGGVPGCKFCGSDIEPDYEDELAEKRKELEKRETRDRLYGGYSV